MLKTVSPTTTAKDIRSNSTTGLLEVTGPAAGTTRVMTVPDADFTAARADAAQTLVGNQTITSGNLLLGGATSIAETLTGQIRTGSTVVLRKDTPQVTPGGTLDLTVNTSTLFGQPGGFVGILSVSAVRLNFNTQSTKTVYAVVARGTTHTFTSLQSQNGVNGGSAFTLTMPSNGVIQFTDTSGSGSNIVVQMSFVGTLTSS